MPTNWQVTASQACTISVTKAPPCKLYFSNQWPLSSHCDKHKGEKTLLRTLGNLALPNFFLRQHATLAVVAPTLASVAQAASTTATSFDVSDAAEPGPAASTAASSLCDPMQVIGECPGDKRKSECLQQSSPSVDGALDGDIIGDEAPMVIPASHAQTLGTPLEPLRVALEAFVPQSRRALRESLKLRNKEQARERRSRTEAQLQKSCPYSDLRHAQRGLLR